MSMEPELAIVVVETGKVPNARVWSPQFASGLSNQDGKPSATCGPPEQVSVTRCPLEFDTDRSLDGDAGFFPRASCCALCR